MSETAPGPTNFNESNHVEHNENLFLLGEHAELLSEERTFLFQEPEFDGDPTFTEASIATDVKSLLQKFELNPLQRTHPNDMSSVREKAVGLIFRELGMLPSDSFSNDQFTSSYRNLEQELADKDSSEVTDLVTELLIQLDEHPVVKVVDMIVRITPYRESVVHIRRMSTLLLAQHLPANQ